MNESNGTMVLTHQKGSNVNGSPTLVLMKVTSTSPQQQLSVEQNKKQFEPKLSPEHVQAPTNLEEKIIDDPWQTQTVEPRSLMYSQQEPIQQPLEPQVIQPLPQLVDTMDKSKDEKLTWHEIAQSLPLQSQSMEEPHFCWTINTYNMYNNTESSVLRKLRDGSTWYVTFEFHDKNVSMFLNVSTKNLKKIEFQYSFLDKDGFHQEIHKKFFDFNEVNKKQLIQDICKSKIENDLFTIIYILKEKGIKNIIQTNSNIHKLAVHKIVEKEKYIPGSLKLI